MATSCKLHFLFFRAEMSAQSVLKEWCHPMGEDLVPGDLQREIVTGSPGADGDFGACVPLRACALLTREFGQCQELAGSPAQCWGKLGRLVELCSPPLGLTQRPKSPALPHPPSMTLNTPQCCIPTCAPFPQNFRRGLE